MVRLGKTYGNLMIDLRPTNEKLRDRSVRIVSEIADSTSEQALEALEASEWDTKVASTMLVGTLGASEASTRLHENEGQLRSTLDSLRVAPGTTPRPHSHHQHWTRLGVAAALVAGRRGSAPRRDKGRWADETRFGHCHTGFRRRPD
jgi:hypothetical protein